MSNVPFSCSEGSAFGLGTAYEYLSGYVLPLTLTQLPFGSAADTAIVKTSESTRRACKDMFLP